MILKGIALKVGDDISTDLIIAGRYKFFTEDKLELARHVMEDYDKNFYSRIKPYFSFIVAGKNFGTGSSREQAPQAIKYAKINAVIAKGFARIFYRNSFNIGLGLMEADTDKINDGDELELDLNNGILTNITKNMQINASPIPNFMQQILKEGGIVKYIRKHGGLKFDI